MDESDHNTSMMALDLQAVKYFKLNIAQMNGDINSHRGSNHNRQQIASNERVEKESDRKMQPKPVKRQFDVPKSRQRKVGSTSAKDSELSSKLTAGGCKQNVRANLSTLRERNSQVKRSSLGASGDRASKQSFGVNKNNQIECHEENLSWSNSLPSISSSPSLSPSLVCPHLSLDDLLSEENRFITNQRNHLSKYPRSATEGNIAMSQSPHTIGLCPKCRLSPPPNLHSPLSPIFAASQQERRLESCGLKRGYSDQHDLNHRRTSVNYSSQKRGGKSQRDSYQIQNECATRIFNHNNNSDRNNNNYKTNVRRIRDDSLDYFLDPEVARMSQLSPIMCHSVGFIRTHSSESSRVIKIYKNGQAYDWPLRLCLGRSEFKSLNHLLDHINDRLSISYGARYLFHLDGQLVYSVNELKHNHSYLVSGTRHFDLRSSQIIRDQSNSRNGSASNLTNELEANKLPHLLFNSNAATKKHVNSRHKHQLNGQKLINDQIGLDKEESDKKKASLNDIYNQQPSASAQSNVSKHLSKSPTSNSKEDLRGHLATKARIERPDSIKSTLTSLINNDDDVDNFIVSSRVKTREVGVNATPETRTFTRKVAQLDSSNAKEVTRTTSETVVAKSGPVRVSIDNVAPRQPASLIRARSDTNGLTSMQRSHRKKNVTFMDTGRGSSPALTNVGLGSQPDFLITEPSGNTSNQDQVVALSLADNKTAADSQSDLISSLEMRDIGIQVSDSIEGFLIDLPIAIPGKMDKDDSVAKHSYLRKGQGQAGSKRPSSNVCEKLYTNNKSMSLARKRPNPATIKPTNERRQIVTISERQLSKDEMFGLRDLDRGDHHHEWRQIAPSPPASQKSLNLSMEANLSTSSSTLDQKDPLQNVSLYIDETIVPCPPTTLNNQQLESVEPSDRSIAKITQSSQDAKTKDSLNNSKEQPEETWQQPRGSATPAERPVSQSAANESVHARITTPTPSLSTNGGDTTSLSISYETTYHWIQRQQQLQQQQQHQFDEHAKGLQFPLVELPEKERVPILAQLCSGSSEPNSTFKLIWINGFSINHAHSHNTPSNNNNSQFLTTTPSATSDQVKQAADHFAPNDRFQNWVHHSLKHDEILYPVGRLVILWCRWTNEQRYYGEHASNICALSLGPDETDLAVSAQISEPKENIQSLVHVWSITKLQLLHKIDARDPTSSANDQDPFRVFSLRLNVVQASPGCLELIAGLCNAKRLWMNHYELRPLAAEVDGDDAKSGFKTLETKAYKAIQQHQPQQQQQSHQNKQIPLLVCSANFHSLQSVKYIPRKNSDLTSYIQDTGNVHVGSGERRMSRSGGSSYTLLFALGRRLFQVWLLEPAKLGTSLRNLRPLQCEQRQASFVGAISRANCWLHWSQNQLMLGDSAGNVTFIELSLYQTPEQAQQSIKNKSPSSNSTKSPTKYRIDRTSLLLSLGAPLQVTCLTRVSNSIFLIGDSTGGIQAYKLESTASDQSPFTANLFGKSLKIPEDFGCACCIVLARYSRSLLQMDFYITSSTNSIMFASIQAEKEPAEKSALIAPPASLSIVYDGHETSVISLVPEANFDKNLRVVNEEKSLSKLPDCSLPYFTCSLDCKICKWQGKSLVWKSVLPSACASMALHPTGFVLAVGSGDGTVYVLDKVSGLLISYFPLTPVCINCLAYSRDGSLLAAGCANGSIFILPVLERGLKYNKVSIFQSPYPVLSVQFSMDSKYILTSVTHGLYQELILWDLPNFRYMRNEVTQAADKIRWFDSICSGSEDVRAIWENANMASACQDLIQSKPAKLSIRRQSVAGSLYTNPTQSIVNLSCHRLIRGNDENGSAKEGDQDQNLVIASDIRGFVRLFQYPCYDIQQGFYQIRISSSPVNCCRFLTILAKAKKIEDTERNDENCGLFVTTSVDGSICLWQLVPKQTEAQ